MLLQSELQKKIVATVLRWINWLTEFYQTFREHQTHLRAGSPAEDHFGRDDTIVRLQSTRQGAFMSQRGRTSHSRNLKLEESKAHLPGPTGQQGRRSAPDSFAATASTPASSLASSPEPSFLKGSQASFRLLSSFHEVGSGH